MRGSSRPESLNHSQKHCTGIACVFHWPVTRDFSKFTGKRSSDCNPHVRYSSICMDILKQKQFTIIMQGCWYQRSFNFWTLPELFPRGVSFWECYCWIADTSPKSMVFNVVFIRFKVRINSTAAVPWLSLVAVFQWLRLCHYLKRFKVTAFKQSLFSLSHIPKYQSQRKNWFIFPNTLQMTSLIKRVAAAPTNRKVSALKRLQHSRKTAFELQNPQGPRVLFFSVCFQDTCFNMSPTHGGEGDIHVGQRQAPWEFGGGELSDALHSLERNMRHLGVCMCEWEALRTGGIWPKFNLSIVTVVEKKKGRACWNPTGSAAMQGFNIERVGRRTH